MGQIAKSTWGNYLSEMQKRREKDFYMDSLNLRHFRQSKSEAFVSPLQSKVKFIEVYIIGSLIYANMFSTLHKPKSSSGEKNKNINLF